MIIYWIYLRTIIKRYSLLNKIDNCIWRLKFLLQINKKIKNPFTNVWTNDPSKGVPMHLLFLQGLWSRPVHRHLARLRGLRTSLSFLWLMLLVLLRSSFHRLQARRFRQSYGGMRQVLQVLHFWLCSLRCRMLRWDLQLRSSGPAGLQHRSQGLCRPD